MPEPKTFSPGPAPPSAINRELPVGEPYFESAPTPLVRYGVAVALVIAAFLLRLAFFGGLTNRLPFAFFLPAAVIAAWYGGMGPGLLAAGIGLLLGDYFFLPPHKSLGPIGEAERTAIGVYAITATLVVMLMENLHGKIRRLRRALKKDALRDSRTSSPGPG